MATDKQPDSRESSLASGWMIEGAQRQESVGSDVSAHEVADSGAVNDESPGRSEQQLSSWALVLFGLVGGVYLLYTFVWASWAQHYSQILELRAAGLVTIDVVLQRVMVWLSVFAPALWFVTAYVFNKSQRNRFVLWLLLGVAVLIPLPMFFEAAPVVFTGGGTP